MTAFVSFLELELPPKELFPATTGTSNGTANVSGTGRVLKPTVGISAGVASISGTGKSLFNASSSVSGIASVSGNGNSLEDDPTGTSSASGSAIGIGASLVIADGLVEATSTVSGFLSQKNNIIGNATATSSARAWGLTPDDGSIGISEGISDAVAVGESFATSSGNSVAIGSASSIRPFEPSLRVYKSRDKTKVFIPLPRNYTYISRERNTELVSTGKYKKFVSVSRTHAYKTPSRIGS